MNEVNSQGKGSLAWYKLADLIARKEREKALSVFRLLSHSFPDKAFCLQIEGDILHALEDQEAYEKYRQSAYLYAKERRWINAAAIGEHLLTQHPENNELLTMVIDLYVLLDWEDKVTKKLDYFIECFKNQKVSQDQCNSLFLGLTKRALGSPEYDEKPWLKEVIVTYAEAVSPWLVARIHEQFEKP